MILWNFGVLGLQIPFRELMVYVLGLRRLSKQCMSDFLKNFNKIRSFYIIKMDIVQTMLLSKCL